MGLKARGGGGGGGGFGEMEEEGGRVLDVRRERFGEISRMVLTVVLVTHTNWYFRSHLEIDEN